MDITTFDPVIAEDLEEEAKLTARYTELMASAKLEIDGRTINLSGLAPYAEDPDRARRHQAEALRWGFFAAHGDELDEIYDKLVALRHGMAVKLGYENYIALGYRRMRRVDYDADRRRPLPRPGGGARRAAGGEAAGGPPPAAGLGQAACLGRGTDRSRPATPSRSATTTCWWPRRRRCSTGWTRGSPASTG